MNTLTKIKRLALALCFVTPLVSWAAGGSATNPVTGAAESYQYYFVGGDATNPGDWATQANWKVGSDDSDYTTLNKNYAPAVYINNNSGETYGTVLFDGVNCPDNKTITSTGSKIEGWTFKIGAYNGVDVTIDHLDLWSAGQGNVGSSAASVDATSKITIKEINNGKNWPSTIDYYIAANEGLTYKGAFRPTGGSDLGTIRYWFAGAGSVVYEDVVEKCAHVIKQADVTLTGGAKEVKFKTLVTFASTTKTFSADNALITVKNSGGTAVRGVRLSSVTSGTTLTTDNNVGDCELVQTATDVRLYFVDGDAAAITYTPSISINFRDSDSNTLNTFEDVGLTGYAVPGTVWNNYTIPNNANEQTFNTVNQIDSAGDSSAVSGATVTVSGHRGCYYCSSLDASTDPRRGYIDDGNSAETMSPSVTITGIPYDNYRVIVYHATDSNGALFGYDTINGTDFTYVDGQQTIGTTGWGASGAQNTALPIQEGVNTLVSGILSGSTVTMVAHRMSNPTARGCFAAIQVVEVAVSDSDLVINVNGNTEYEVTESKQYDNVIIAGTGNLTFTGEGTITADTLNIDPVAAVVKVNSTQLSVSKVIGNGVALYEGALPPDGAGWWTDASEWKGTVWIKNYTTKLSAFESNKYGNNSSVLRLTGLNGHLQRTTTAAPYTHMTLELVDDGNTAAFTYNDGWGGSAVYISALKGNGTFAANSAGNGEIVYVADPSAFTGSFNLTHKKVQLGGSAPNGDNKNWNGKILIPSGATVTAASGASWAADGGIDVEGTLNTEGVLGLQGKVTIAAGGTLTNNGRIWAVGGITVNGTLKTDKYTTTDSGRFGSGTAITLGDTGVFELASTGDTNDGSTSYSQITGTGKIKYSGSGYWVLSSNHPTAITLEAEQASALVVPAAGATIGSLTGTKGFRSDWGTNPAAGRYLTIKQFKDTSWSGSINQPSATHRLTGVVVDPGESTTGTLEVTGTQTASATLTVNGSVNLTGTWKGATTVAGTFGGTGTLTGALTFNTGSTFKAFASDTDGLSVSGSVAFPTTDGESVTVDLSGITLSGSGTTLITTTGGTINDISKLSVSGAVLALESDDTVLKAYPIAALVERDGTPHFYDNIAQAMSAAMLQYSQTYDHFELYASIGETVSLDATWLSLGAFKLKTCNGATVTVQAASAEYSSEAGEADENGIVTYTGGNAATTYTWNWSSGTATWNLPKNWTYGNGTTATRAPVAGDTVVFNDGATVTLVGDAACAAMQVSGAVTISGGRTLTSASAITLETGDSITITGTLSPVPSTTVANSYVKATISDSTTTYRVDAYNTVTFAGDNYTLWSVTTNGAEVAISEGTCKVEDGAITFTVAPNSGYAVTGVTASSGEVTESSGTYSYTVTANATITVTTVSTSITIDSPAVAYFASYTNATVTANVTGEVLEGTTFTLSGTGITGSYTGTYENGVVTFNNVHGYALGDTITYTISATGGSSGTLENQTSDVGGAAAASSAWMAYSKSGPNVGSWKNGDGGSVTPDYGDNDYAAFTGTNIYTAAWMSTGEVVTVTTNVKFGSPADSELTVDADAQAAIRIGTEQGANVFQIYAGPTSSWVSVYNDTLGTPADDATYALTLTLNYASQTFGVSVGDAGALTNATGTASFPLAKAASAMQQVSYLGAGSFISLSGQYVSAGYTADVGTEGSATNVVVSSDFVNTYMGDVLASNVSAALSPTNTTKQANGLNYFASYALGLDPTDKDDKPTIKVETNSEGKFVVTLVDGNGDPIVGAANVALTLKFQSGTDPNSLTTETISSFSEGSATIDPSTMEGNVKYYKVRIDIGAK